MTIQPDHPQPSKPPGRLQALREQVRARIQERQSGARHRTAAPAQDKPQETVSPTPVQIQNIRSDRVVALLLILCLLLSALIYGAVSCVRHFQGIPDEVQTAYAPVVQGDSTPAASDDNGTATTAPLGSRSDEDSSEPTEPAYTPPEDAAKRYGMYQQNLVVVGDSIASGFSLYGFIPEEHGLAHGNMAIRSLHDYTFTYEGAEVDVMDAIEGMQPTYLYISMGMNDLNMITVESYVELYQKEIQQMLAVSPQSNVVVAGITPIELNCSFTTGDKIQTYNAALQQMVADFGQDNILYFDAYSVLADPATGALGADYTAGDGVHLSVKSYETMLQALYPYLDQMPYTANCDAAMEAYLAQTATEATEAATDPT